MSVFESGRILVLGDEQRALEPFEDLGDGGEWRVGSRLCRFDALELDGELQAADVIIVAARGERFGVALAMIQECRRSGLSVPLLMSGASGQHNLAAHALYAGADDYQCMPFAHSELLARIRALNRRKHRTFALEHDCGDFVLDRTMRELLFKGREIELSATQFRVIERLFLRGGAAVSVPELLDVAFGYDADMTEGAVRALISRIRRQLRRAGAPDIVRVKWGVGYYVAVTKNS